MPSASPSGLSECYRETAAVRPTLSLLQRAKKRAASVKAEVVTLVVEVIVQAYKENNLTVPAGMKCHSTRSISTYLILGSIKRCTSNGHLCSG